MTRSKAARRLCGQCRFMYKKHGTPYLVKHLSLEVHEVVFPGSQQGPHHLVRDDDIQLQQPAAHARGEEAGATWAARHAGVKQESVSTSVVDVKSKRSQTRQVSRGQTPGKGSVVEVIGQKGVRIEAERSKAG